MNALIDVGRFLDEMHCKLLRCNRGMDLQSNQRNMGQPSRFHQSFLGLTSADQEIEDES